MGETYEQGIAHTSLLGIEAKLIFLPYTSIYLNLLAEIILMKL
jgi:hypothetical protein